jgi:SAM-dependent methyltransferase
MPDKARFYVECARVLRPGGVFLGLEWLQRDGLTASEAAQHIEPICRCFAVPHLATLAELERYLCAAGLQVEVIEDVSARGNILRNWELVDAKNMDGVRSFVPTLVMATVKALRSIAPGLLPPTLRLLTDGGVALTEAARAGAFLIGHWRARKPAAGDR